MKPEYTKFEEQIFFSTLRIERPATNSMGTGFLVQVESCVPGRHYIFLVSNRHVLDDPTKETLLSIHLKSVDGNPLLGEVFNVKISQFLKGYYCPDSSDIDLALLNVSEIVDLAKAKTGKDANFRGVTLDLFSDYTEVDLIPNQRITFIGYPNNFYDKKNYLPILRSGIIASIPKVDFEGKPLVIVDAQVFQGSSGSPVFAVLGNSWKFIGVICQTMLKNQKIEIIDTAKAAITQEVIGIGVMIKSTHVMELIKKAKMDLDKINCPK